MQEQKKVLVTGATGDIGCEIVRLLLTAGYFLIAHGRSLEVLKKKFLDIESNMLSIVVGDLASREGRRSIIKQLCTDYNDIDVLINCAGGAGEHQTWWNTSEDKWNDVFQLNVLGTAELCQTVSKGMMERGWGRIINIASVAAFRPLEIGPEYASAKAAVIALTVSLAKACGSQGVTVNSISPGLVLTQAVKEIIDRKSSQCMYTDADYHKYASENLFVCLTGRLTEVKQIAETVRFLLSDAASNITAQDIVLDGGYLSI